MSSKLPSSGADGVGDTTLFIATAASYASDGPTLPIIGGAGEHSDWVAPTKDRSTKDDTSSRPAKKQRTKKDLGKDAARPVTSAKKTKNEVEGLYEPWTLLPAEVSRQVEKRLNGKWEEKVEAVVWTKNQNVKSGINRLKGLLGFEETREADERGGRDIDKRDDGGLIAVSAYGEGTAKLVSIVEMTKRIVSGVGKGTKEDRVETWFTYTSLSSTSEQDVKNRVPVLSVWFSQKSIPELKTAFGEQTFKITHATFAD